ncbi:MAG: tyrosine-type recombinase/integrase [Ignavibacteriaceae bacterium]
MASIYSKRDIIYVSWYDSLTGKRFNKSTRLKATKENFRIAKSIANELQVGLQNEHDVYKELGIQKKTISAAFEHFLKNNSDKHPKTIKDYHRFYKFFKMDFDENEICTVITKLEVENWITEIKKLPYQRNSIFDIWKQASHFINFLFEYSYIPMFKINKDIKPKSEIKEKIVFSEEDIVKIFDGLKTKNNNFRTLVYVAFYSGLRSSDMLSIKVSDVDLKRRELKYYSPKRKVYRQVAFHEDLVPVLSARMNVLTEGKLLDYNNVETLARACNRYFEQLKIIDKGYSARTFRKTFITLARRCRMDASVVAELVGHAHSSTTDRFYNRIDLQQMSEELRKFKIPGNFQLQDNEKGK